jgi:hypothetical protein
MRCNSATPHPSDAPELVALVPLAALCEEAPHWGTKRLVYFIDEIQKISRHAVATSTNCDTIELYLNPN